jgi:hypothetical protein
LLISSDPGSYTFTGVLRVGTIDSSGGTHYRGYDTGMNLELIETTEQPGRATHNVTGTVNFGEFGETEYEIYDGTLTVGGGVVTLDINAQPIR